jgi:hypothetical protein
MPGGVARQVVSLESSTRPSQFARGVRVERALDEAINASERRVLAG